MTAPPTRHATSSLRHAAEDRRVELFDVPAGEGGRGKSRALNLGCPGGRVGGHRHLRRRQHAGQGCAPLPGGAARCCTRSSAQSSGKFRTVNKNVNLLTRFINIETLSFQSMLQAGRWQMHNIATLPGTNFVMWTAADPGAGRVGRRGADRRLGAEHPDLSGGVQDQVRPVRDHLRTGAAGVEGLGETADAMGAGEQLRDRRSSSSTFPGSGASGWCSTCSTRSRSTMSSSSPS